MDKNFFFVLNLKNMLGLALIYFCGKYFYELALEFEKNKWLYAFLGVLIYYCSMLIVGIIFMGVMEINTPGYIDNMGSTIWLDFLLLPVGIFFTWLFYKFLEKKWRSKLEHSDSDILDDVFLND